MQRRPSARLLILDDAGHVLVFRFAFSDGALAGETYWATPGGGLDAGESYEEAAIREMREETGIAITAPGLHVAERECVVPMPDGESVVSVERYFVVKVGAANLSRAGWTQHETKVMVEHRWWPVPELEQTATTVWPKNLPEILAHAAMEPAQPPLRLFS